MQQAVTDQGDQDAQQPTLIRGQIGPEALGGEGQKIEGLAGELVRAEADRQEHDHQGRRGPKGPGRRVENRHPSRGAPCRAGQGWIVAQGQPALAPVVPCARAALTARAKAITS